MPKLNPGLLYLLLLCAHPAWAQTPAPAVLVTIKPLHSLVAGVMHGVAEPVLLITATGSLHHITLKPSQRRLLAQADLVFWLGPALETFMPRVINSLQSGQNSVALSQAPGLRLLAMRDKAAHQHAHGAIDAHLWLDPHNAQHMVQHIARQLIALDPAHAARYQANANWMQQAIDRLQLQLNNQLANSSQPFISHHDSLQYFEHAFNLRSLGVLTNSNDTPVSARQLQQLRAQLAQHPMRCVLYDTAVKPPIVTTLLEGHSATAIAIDTTGRELTAGRELWFELMRKLAEQLRPCVKNS